MMDEIAKLKAAQPQKGENVMAKYRRLKMGEIIKEGDEYDNCCNPWHDDPVWVPATCIGEPAPNPNYASHRQYRRRIDKESEGLTMTKHTPKTSKLTRKCENCRFWHQTVTTPDRFGQCRFDPPPALKYAQTGSTFPETHPDEWCGQFVPNYIASKQQADETERLKEWTKSQSSKRPSRKKDRTMAKFITIKHYGNVFCGDQMIWCPIQSSFIPVLKDVCNELMMFNHAHCNQWCAWFQIKNNACFCGDKWIGELKQKGQDNDPDAS